MNPPDGRLLLCLLLAVGIAAPAAAIEDETMNRLRQFSLNTGSFIYHAYAPHQQFTQYFQNHFVAVEKRLRGKAVDNLVAGTFINSDGNRCLLLGVQKNWRQLGRRTTFEGLYAYAGEFFVDAFADCGASGLYHDLERATGVGFLPYLYHGIEFDLGEHASLEAGAIAPGILVLSLQWHF